jgi:hypothetical protein
MRNEISIDDVLRATRKAGLKFTPIGEGYFGSAGGHTADMWRDAQGIFIHIDGSAATDLAPGQQRPALFKIRHERDIARLIEHWRATVA